MTQRSKWFPGVTTFSRQFGRALEGKAPTIGVDTSEGSASIVFCSLGMSSEDVLKLRDTVALVPDMLAALDAAEVLLSDIRSNRHARDASNWDHEDDATLETIRTLLAKTKATP